MPLPFHALLLMLLCALLSGAAPAGAAPARTLRFEQLSVEQGLAQESVLAIAQDRQGFMWFGSQAGLSRFDGYRTTVYRNIAGDASSLADNWVRALHVDADGVLWIGTDGGLDRFDPLRRTFTHFAPREPGRRGNGNVHVRAIVDDGVGGFWLATLDGLQRFNPASGRFTIWHHDKENPASVRDDQINALARDASGRLWVGTTTGLDMLAPGSDSFQHWDIDPAPASRRNAVQALLVDADRSLWIGTLAGVERWRLGDGAPQRSRFGPGEGIVAGAITSIYQDGDANLWIGSYTDGLFCWLAPLGRFAQYRHRPGDSHSVAADQIAALYRDRVGTFWVGTWYDGVSRVDLGSGGFGRLTKTAGIGAALSDHKVHAMAEDRTGTLWLGTHSGLNRLDPASGAVRVYRHDPRQPDSLAGDDVAALWQGRGDTLWIGGNAGLSRLNTASGRFARLALAQGDAASAVVRSISGDRAGKLWVASRGGLHRVDPGSGAVKTFRHDPADSSSLADNRVRPVLEDSSGALWVGTFHGLDLMERKSGHFRHFRHAQNDLASLSHDDVHCLYEDKQGALWVGTANGLNRMERGPDGGPRFRRYLRRDGMADDAIFGILGDDANGLWVSTNSGISRLDTRTGQFRNYDGNDGTVEGAYFDGSALRGRDGTLYFGGFNGITAFAPTAVKGNSVAPPVAITDFQIFNRSVEAGRGDYPDVLRQPIEHTAALTLKEAASVFSLEFSALHYAAPQHNRYAYRLQGFDHDWVHTDAGKRFATYTNLDPGHYVFQVKAANKDGLWSAAGATLAITILPPFWKTWWFRSLLAVLLLGSAYAGYRARMRGMRRQRNRLEQQVSLRTAEVEQKNRILRRQEKQVRLHTEELALANRALQENDERLRLEKRRAEEATEQKSVFLANISHEMRTPLAGVIGMLGFALRDQDLHESTRGQIQRGQANAEALLAIINDLLDLSKIEAGKLGIETIDFALVAAIGNVLGLFEEQAAAAGIGFSAEFAQDLPPFVVGDPSRLRQVLINLLGNAFKFTERGAVKLCVERAGMAGDVNLIRFVVRDTGIGIAAEAVARLFEKFEQADSTTTRRYGGTGLGLAICRQLVELMGGQIAVTSRPGAGSSFTFVLPLPDGAAPLPLPAVRLAPHRHRLRVLCAEDFPTNQIIVRMLLEALGHQVEVVANGALAVAACARAHFDLILMDGRMPEMDGASAARLIRAGGPGHDPVFDPDVMIVALTANAGDEDRARYLAAGMDDFLSKPIEEAALHSVLGHVIGRQLRRGMALEPMSAPAVAASPGLEPPDQVPGAAPRHPCIDELDRMFKVAPAPSRQSATGDLKQRICVAFAADIGPRLDELERAVALRDGEVAAVLLHGLKGSAAYLDDDELRRLCAQLELEADLANWQSLEAALPRLRRLLGRIASLVL